MQQSEIQLSSQASAINQSLSQLIGQKIETNDGAISFAEYMQMALYAPELGYYQNNLHKFGELGDFITAPEMGDLFALGIANSIASLSSELTQNILEIGAGTGQMAADCLIHLANQQRLPKNYYILEPSASLQSLQSQTIRRCCPQLATTVHWLSGLPQQFQGVILANEVVDAIPFERIIKKQKSWKTLGVSLAQQQFVETIMAPVAQALLPKILREGDYPEDYTTEIRPLVGPWLKGLAGCLQAGVVYLFDYGYPELEFYHPQRVDGSLRCFSQHQSNNQPLDLSGLQDITAHVDFTQLARLGVENGFDIDGFTTQAGFLLENQVLSAIQARQEGLSEAKHYQLSQQLQKLTAPGQMGEIVKVIAMSKNSSSMPSGFTLQNQMHRL